MPITDSGVVTIGASAPLAGIYQSVAGQTNPTGYPLDGLRQGTGKFFKGQDSPSTTGQTRQLGILASNKYRCLQGQSTTTYTLLTTPSENINLQGQMSGPAGAGGGTSPGIGQAGGTGGLALGIQTGTNLSFRVGGALVGGGGGGGAAGSGGGWTGSAGGAGGVAVATFNSAQVTIYTSGGTFVGGGGGGGGSASVVSPGSAAPISVYTSGNGGGGAAGFGGGGGAQANSGQAGTAVTGGAGGASYPFITGPPAAVNWQVGAGGRGGNIGQAGQAAGTTIVIPPSLAAYVPPPGVGAGGAAGASFQGSVTVV